ncbi:MAG: hypothetical protein DMG21_06645 [Acidobacteria bacterium]|nr:MAG: hypothetical protein DMG21_06645 [Acidobacteriota bacterium]
MRASSKPAEPPTRRVYAAFRRLNSRSRRDVALRILKDQKLLDDLYDHLLIQRALAEPGVSVAWQCGGSGRS